VCVCEWVCVSVCECVWVWVRDERWEMREREMRDERWESKVKCAGKYAVYY